MHRTPHLLAFAGLAALALSADDAVFTENFETQGKTAFNGLTQVQDAKGNTAAQLVVPAGKELAGAYTPAVYPVKPDSWYRLTFRHRNNIMNGELKIGVRESRDATKMVGEYYAYQWKALSLNISEWNTYSFEFKTALDTKALRIQIETANQFNGSSWWDDIAVNAFTPVFDPVEILPFNAAASYTDIPTKRAYRVTDGEPTLNNLQHKTTYHWETLDLAKATVTVKYRNLPKDSTITLNIRRGNGDKGASITQKADGTGTLDFAVNIADLPEGIHAMTAILNRPDGSSFTSPVKELWRISHAKCATPKLDPITISSVGPNRQRLVNGKIYHTIHLSTAPTWGLLHHHQTLCKPDLDTYLANLQEQFGADCVTMWAWRANRWDGKEAEFTQNAIGQYREYLDYLAEHNFYAMPGFVFSTERGRMKTISLDDIKTLAAALKDHPAILEWTLDEPEIPRYSPEVMLQCYKTLKDASPKRIVNVNLCDPAKFHLYAPCTDIGSFDVYPFPGQNLLENDRRMAKLIAAFPDAPLDSYLQMFNFNTLAMPNFDQIRGEFIFDRISGSTSLVAYSWGERRQSFQTDMELQAYFRAIVAMYRALTPVLDRATKVDLNLKANAQIVRSRFLRDGDETIALLVNLAPDTDAHVSIPTQAKSAEDFFDPAWTYPLADGACTFTLKPNKTAVIRFK